VDLDHFKRVNDTWGHHVGDLVLRMTAKTLTASLRPLDVVCRWGGEEFLILIPNIESEGLAVLAGRIRMLLENSWIDHEGERISVTGSFGGAISEKGESAESVVDRADKQVYLSKGSGRNCIHIGDVKLNSAT
jgi:diguanylate cyclase (GGDEF)-like protein